MKRTHYEWPREWRDARRDFGNAFGVPIGDFYDPLISFVRGRISINIVLFDKWLHAFWSEDYEMRGLSMMDFLSEKYGKEKTELIKILL